MTKVGIVTPFVWDENYLVIVFSQEWERLFNCIPSFVVELVDGKLHLTSRETIQK